MPKEFLIAICLVLVIEGFLPFLSPASWRRTLAMLIACSDKSIRLIGLASMVLGVLLLTLVNG